MIELTYTLELASPLRIGTGIGQAGYLDNTIARNGSGQAIIPGSSLKGKARAMSFRLAQGLSIPVHALNSEPGGCLSTTTPCLICRIFGATQWPGSLYFANAELHPYLKNVLDDLDREAQEKNQHPKNAVRFGRHVRTSVALDRRRRVALPQRLFTHETVQWPATFGGSIKGEIADLSADYREVALLSAAIEAITHLGGARGRGVGRCILAVQSVTVHGVDFPRENWAAGLTALGEVAQ